MVPNRGVFRISSWGSEVRGSSGTEVPQWGPWAMVPRCHGLANRDVHPCYMVSRCQSRDISPNNFDGLAMSSSAFSVAPIDERQPTTIPIRAREASPCTSFCAYRNLQRHRAVPPAIARLLLSLWCNKIHFYDTKMREDGNY